MTQSTHARTQAVSLEMLEPRMLLTVDPTASALSYGAPAGSTPIIIGAAPDPTATLITNAGITPDYDWWYGCAPTAGGMFAAYYEMQAKFATLPANLNAGPYAGNTGTWQYGKYPGINYLYSQPGGAAVINSTLYGVPDYANGAVAGWNHQYDATWSGRDLNWVGDTWVGHLPDSIADFMQTSTMQEQNQGEQYWNQYYSQFDQHLYYNGTTANNAEWGLANYMAWDDPRTPENESYPMSTVGLTSVVPAGPLPGTTTVGPGVMLFDPYKAAIDAGKPVLVFLTSAEADSIELEIAKAAALAAGQTFDPSTFTANQTDPALDSGNDNHVVLGVGYYVDTTQTPPKNYLEVLTDWSQGIVQIPMLNIGGANKWYASQMLTGAAACNTVQSKGLSTEPAPGLTGYFSIACPDASKITVQIGLGDPNNPVWQYTNPATGKPLVFDPALSPSSQSGIALGMSNYNGYANLVMSDVNLGGATNYLSSHPNEAGKGNTFYIKVTDTDGANAASSYITDFQVRYNSNGSHYTYVTGNRQTPLKVGTTSAFATVNLDGEVRGTVYNDLNGNGVRDAGEPGIAGRTVYLSLDSDDDGVGDTNSTTATTAADGSYSFTHLPAAEYIVNETAPSGWGDTTTTTRTGKLYGQVVTNVDFGTGQNVTLQGTVYNDTNHNGTLDAGETGIPGRTVFLDTNGNGLLDTGEKSVVTNAAGLYSFTGILPGTYGVVDQLPFGAVSTNPAGGALSVAVASGATSSGNNFLSYMPPLPDLADNTGSAGDTFSPNAVAPGEPWSASFVIKNQGAGDSGAFTVRFYASLDQTIIDPASTDPLAVKDYVLGNVSMSGIAAGATGTATLNLTSFPQLPAGQYYIAAVIDYAAAVPESNETNNTVIDAAQLTMAGIRGKAWYDANNNGALDAGEVGMPNETVYVDLNNNGKLDAGEPTAVTDTVGNYSLPSLPAGTYMVRELPQVNWSFTAPVSGGQQVTLFKDQLVSNVNFGNFRANLPDLVDGGDAYSLFSPTSIVSPGGKWDVFWDVANKGTGASGPFTVQFYLSTDASMATTADNILLGSQDVASIAAGGYKDINLSLLSFPNVPDGNYYVGVVIDSANTVFEKDETNNTSIDTDHYPLLVTNLPDLTDAGDDLSGFKPGTILPGQPYSLTWSVTNQGKKDAGPFYVCFFVSTDSAIQYTDTHLGTITVPGLKAGATVKVPLSGFSFPDLEPGQYYVGAIIDAGGVLNPNGNVLESNEANNIGVDLNGYPLTVAVNTAAVQGVAFYDQNGDGVRNPLEPGLYGWTVYADVNKNGKWDAGEPSTISDVNGHYWLQGLAAGTYTITELPQQNWGSTQDATGVNYTQSVTLTAGQTRSDVNFGDAPYSKIAGTVWKDGDGNATSDIGERQAPKPGDALLDGAVIYLFNDLNDNGRLDPAELNTVRTTVSANGGSYSFGAVLPGTYIVYQPNNLVVNGTTYIQTNPLTQTESATMDGTGKLVYLPTPVPAQTVNITGAELVGGINFGEALPSEIDGIVWNDLNGDGIHQPAEPVQSGVTVYLDQNLNNVLDPGEVSTTTATDGSYFFIGLRPGTYYVNEIRPAGWAQSLPAVPPPPVGQPPAPPSAFVVWQVQIPSGDIIDVADFGNYQPCTIGGYVFHDLDADGVFKQGSEPGLAGWDLSAYLDANQNGIQDATEPTIKMYVDANGNGRQDALEPTILTDANGHYQFSGLVPGTYVISLTTQGNYVQSTPATPPGTFTVTVASGDVVDYGNFGEYMYGHISGNVWHDLNADGLVSAAEGPLQGRTIYLDQNQNGKFDIGEAFTTTDANGYYSFNTLIPGPYYVAENLPTDWYQSSPIVPTYHLVTLQSGTTVTGQDFGNYQYGTIQGTVWNDVNGDGIHQLAETPLSGRTVYLDLNNNGALDGLEPSVVTDANGKYSFANLMPGVTYNVRQVLPAMWHQSSPIRGGAGIVTMASQLVAPVNFEDYQYAQVSGNVYRDVNGNGVRDAGESGLAGWQVYLDANGNGRLDALGTAQVTSTPVGGTTLGAGQTIQDNLAVFGVPGLITDLNIQVNMTSMDVSGVSLVLISPSGQRIALVNEGDTSGRNYVNMVLDDQAAAPVLAGAAPYTGSFRPAGSLALLNGSDPNGTWSLEVTDSAGGSQVRLDNWSVIVATPSLAEPVATTDANGNYILTDVVPGTYQVREVIPGGFVQTAPAGGAWTVSLATGDNISNKNFGDIEPASVSGRVWHDVNGNHQVDPGEPALPNWTVTLFRDSNGNGVLDNGETLLSTATDGTGYYNFTGLIPGQYVVSEINQPNQPAWSQLMPQANYTLQVNSLDALGQINFAMAHTGTLGGLVWQDTNGDGLKNAGENGLAGRTVYLDLNSNGVQDSGEPFALTDNQGYYSFANINPGTYKIGQTQPAGWYQTVPGPVTRTLTSAGSVTDANFADYQAGTIQGNVWQDLNGDAAHSAGEPALAGWTVYLDSNGNGTLDAGEASTLTDGAGNYSFTGLKPGSYRVALVSQAPFLTATPAAGTYSETIISGSFLASRDFGEYQSATVSGTVWFDANLNGVMDAGEAPQPGWKVDYFLDANDNHVADSGELQGEVTTNLQGAYTLSNLRPGRYVIYDKIQSTYAQTTPVGGRYTLDVASDVSLTGVNFGLEKAPIANLGSITTNENTPVSGVLTGSDPEGSPVTFVLTTKPAHGALDFRDDGRFTYTPEKDWNGTDSFTFQSNDGYGLSAPATMSVVVKPVNEAPTAIAPPAVVQTDEDTPAVITLNGTDVQMETPAADLLYVITSNPAHGKVVLNGNIATYTPDADYNGPDSFAFTVTDNGDPAGSHANPGDLTSAPAQVNLSVSPVNDAPVANNMDVIVNQTSGDNVFALNGTDVETPTESLIYVIKQQPKYGTVTLEGNIVTYTPMPGYYGQDQFQYTVTDNGDPAGSHANPSDLPSTPGTVNVVVAQVLTFDAKHPRTLFIAPNSPTGLVVSMAGSGTGKLVLTTFGGLDSRRDISRVELSGTDATTVLTIKSTGKATSHSTPSKVGDIVVEGPAKSITVTGAQVRGSVQVAGGLGKLQVADFQDYSKKVLPGILPGVDITVGAADSAKLATQYKLGQVTDLSIDSAMPIAGISAASWLDTDATADVISAPSLGSLTVAGNRKTGAAGDFQADLNLTAPGTLLKSVKVSGGLQGSNWNVNGSIGAVKVGQMASDSTILSSGNIASITVGAADTFDVLASVDPLAGRHAVSAADFLADSRIGSFKATGYKGYAGTTFVDSNLSAASLGTVDLLNVDFAAGDSGMAPFGIFAKQGDTAGVGVVRFKDASGKVWTWGQDGFNAPAGSKLTVANLV